MKEIVSGFMAVDFGLTGSLVKMDINRSTFVIRLAKLVILFPHYS